MATTPATPENPGTTNTAGLAPWASSYITNYLGQAQALGNMPYQTYQGQLTAGASPLQTRAFQGIGSLTVPTGVTSAGSAMGNLANDFGGMSYTPGTFESGFQAPQQYSAVGSSFTDQGTAGKYMNPYLQQALDPQLKEIQRQAAINLQPQMAQLTKAGAFGGSRDAILRAEANRNLLDQISSTTGREYSNAFQQAQQQFNAEQARKIQEAQFGSQQGMTAADLAARYGLEGQRLGEQSRQFGASYGMDALARKLQALEGQGRLGMAESDIQRANLAQMLGAGQMQRDIEQQGLSADYEEFMRQREYPFKQVQFMRDMISGLPIGSVSSTPAPMSGIAQLLSLLGGVDTAAKQTGGSSLEQMLRDLFGGGTE